MVSQKRAKSHRVPSELTVKQKKEEQGQISYQDKHIMDSTYCRLLGMNLQNNMSWDSHLTTGKKALLPACRKKLSMLARLNNCLSTSARLHLVNALIISKLTHGICLWGNTADNLVNIAQITMNIAARFVTGDKRSTSKKVLMNKCNWLDISQLTPNHSLLQMFKTVRWGVPSQ